MLDTVSRAKYRPMVMMIGRAATSRSPRISTPTIEIESLWTIAAYRDCSLRTLRRIRRVSDVVQVVPGTLIHRPEFRLEWAYGILDGTVALGRRADTGLASAGDCIGLADAVLEATASVQIAAVTASTVLVAAHSELLAIAATDPKLAFGIATAIAHECHALQDGLQR